MERDNHINLHAVSEEQIAKLLGSNLSIGLSYSEAEMRLNEFGKNKISEGKKRSSLLLFLSQFKSPIVYLLLFATGLSFYFDEWLEGFAIVIVVFINAIIGFYMEFQAERSMDALKKLTTIPSKIFRNGQLVEYDSVNIVPGDVIYAEAGDMIPADARIFRETQLQVDESALTGESVPVEKTNSLLPEATPLAERINMIYKGTHLTKGNVWAIVTATGLSTELGKIANLVQTADKAVTPLEKKLEDFSKKLIGITLILVVIIFVTGLLHGKNFLEMMEIAIALSVAAIPEGLPIVATLALAQGMLKMARYKVIVKKLSAVETLGGTNIICTDKTGTLTENKVKVTTVLTADSVWDGNALPTTAAFDIMKKIAILCNTAEIKHEGNSVKEIGDPLETGLLKFAEAVGGTIENDRKNFPKVKEEPFTSETKMMTTLHRSDNKSIAYSKGAAEELIKRCKKIVQDNKIEEFNENLKQHWLSESEALASSGLRLIAGAYKECDSENEEISEDLIFVGLFGMMDPPAKEVFTALEECRTAGIHVIMITGDHPATARSIGYQLGISNNNEDVMLGSNMKSYKTLTDSDKILWANTNIFARVSPEQKLDLVTVLQEKQSIVGMTGDGVNDAPALRKADIGIAMGKRGSQVAQEAADMILKDDSFGSIVTAIKHGRIIFDNIQKFVIFLLSCNLSELLVISVVAILNLHFQLFPLQILFINLITDVLPALALGVLDGNETIMKQKPKPIDAPIIDSKRWWTIIFYSSILATTSIGGVIFSHYIVHNAQIWDSILSNNILFYSLIFCQLLHVFNMGKSGTNFFNSEVFKNGYIWFAFTISIVLVLILNFIAPVRKVLSIQPMIFEDWIVSIASAVAATFIIQLAKTFKIVKQ